MRPSPWFVYLMQRISKAIPNPLPRNHFHGSLVSMSMLMLTLISLFTLSGCDDEPNACASNPFCVQNQNTGSSNGVGGSNNGSSGGNNVGGTGSSNSKECTAPMATCPSSQNFCDKNLLTDAINCGVCGLTCASGQTCKQGHCASTMVNECTQTSSEEVCDFVDNDCNGVVDDGINMQSDTSNCGTCGLGCGPGNSCVNAHCKAPISNSCVPSAEICNYKDDNCDGGIDEGYNLLIDVNNCGQCGHICGAGKHCDTGHCTWDVPPVGCISSQEICNYIDDDCDGGIDEGFITLSDPLNCGVCGMDCGTGNTCVNGHCKAPVSNVCQPTAEVCNYIDDDCNGFIDDGINMLADKANCGQCGHICDPGQYCSAGHCAWIKPPSGCVSSAEVCDNIDNNCDGNIDEGFSLLNDEQNCGQCGTACAAGQVCSNAHCTWIIPADDCVVSQELCDGIDNNCNGSIDEPFNKLTDPANCGSCGTVCLPGSTCSNGHCQWTLLPNGCLATQGPEVCDGVDNDCDTVIDNGFNKDSDPNNCGTCGNICPAGTTCQLGHCAYPVPPNGCLATQTPEICDGVDNDCDTVIDDGFDLNNDSLNCGKCGIICGAGQYCSNGHCANMLPPNVCIPSGETCNEIDDNCNTLIDEGINKLTDPANCGQCGVACVAGQYCNQGHCALITPVSSCVPDPGGEVCDYRDNDCNGYVDETIDRLTDINNCGWCGHICGGGQHCEAGHCAWNAPQNDCLATQSPEVCDGIDNDCDDLIDETTNFASDPNNCGSCGHVCPGGTVCQNAHCTLPVPLQGCQVSAEVCDEADNDCDGLIDENTDRQNDANNCGQCGTVCGANQHCQNGHCAWDLPQSGCVSSQEICDGIDNDCDHAIDEGFIKSTDPANCGVCGHVCGAGQYCSNGHCALLVPANSCVNPVAEVCDGIDNNCAGGIDEPFNLSSDPQHCGSCMRVCAAGQYCTNGHCALLVPVNSCVSSQEVCDSVDNDCDGQVDEGFNLQTDKLHCGNCATACAGTATCFNGICQNIACVNNSQCPAGKFCVNSFCQ